MVGTHRDEDPGVESERLLRALAAVIRRGELLRRRGADAAELESNRRDAEHLRWRLAAAVRLGAGLPEAAAA